MNKYLLILYTIFLPNIIFAESLEYILGDFDTLMKKYNNPFYDQKYNQPDNQKNIRLLKKLYEQNHCTKIQRSATVKIPKMIHQIWVGLKPIPKSVYDSQQTWIKFHPNWKYKLWTNDTVREILTYFSQEHLDIYNSCNDPIEQANLLRYYILYLYGGIYADTDFICLKSFEDLHYYYDFYSGIPSHGCEPIISNGLIAATPQNSILAYIINNIHHIDTNLYNNQTLTRFNRTGVYMFSKKILEIIDTAPGINIILPVALLYPFPFGPELKNIENYLWPESLAVHLWAQLNNPNWE